MEKKEISMEVRLLLAFLLMGAVISSLHIFISRPPGPNRGQDGFQTRPRLPNKQRAAPAPAPNPLPAEATAAVAGQVQAEKEETVVIETDLPRSRFSNKGGVVRSWILKATIRITPASRSTWFIPSRWIGSRRLSLSVFAIKLRSLIRILPSSWWTATT